MANSYGITLGRAWAAWAAKQRLSETIAAALYLISEGRKADEVVAKLTPGEMEINPPVRRRGADIPSATEQVDLNAAHLFDIGPPYLPVRPIGASHDRRNRSGI
jgi:hypothetical protein